MARPWAWSLVVHVAIAALAVLFGPGRAPVHDGESTALQLIDLVEVEPPESTDPGPGRGGEPSPGEPSRAVSRAPRPARSPSPVRRPRSAAPTRDEPTDAVAQASARAGSPPAQPGPFSVASSPILGGDGVGIGTFGDGAGGRGTGGAGRGGGRYGRGDQLTSAATRRPSAARTKARRARLVYPKKDRPEREGEVFVVLLSIDEDGYVVGVRLKQGVDPFSNEKALGAVWRFRYAPALDDTGRPIASRLEQRFMLE